MYNGLRCLKMWANSWKIAHQYGGQNKTFWLSYDLKSIVLTSRLSSIIKNSKESVDQTLAIKPLFNWSIFSSPHLKHAYEHISFAYCLIYSLTSSMTSAILRRYDSGRSLSSWTLETKAKYMKVLVQTANSPNLCFSF